jgi:hypothetical protein
MDRLVGISRGQLDRTYGEGLALALTAVLPSLLLMLWSRFDPRTPLLLILAAVGLGVVLWAALLMRLKHPVIDELTIFWRRLRPSSGATAV